MINEQIMNKTKICKSIAPNTWYLVDAKGKTLGRLSTQIAYILRGKSSPSYNPANNISKYIIVINTGDIQITGRKKEQKLYYRHSGRPGGLKTETFEELQKRLPNSIIQKAVKKMLPKGALGRQLFRQLKTYQNACHPHAAQKPVTIDIN